jgi:hypothetical protein
MTNTISYRKIFLNEKYENPFLTLVFTLKALPSAQKTEKIILDAASYAYLLVFIYSTFANISELLLLKDLNLTTQIKY